MNQQPTCEFCDGTGLWPDGEASPPATDPCPLCGGVGVAPDPAPNGVPVPEPVAFEALLARLPDLTQAERQRLYELLHARYDCRVYR